MLFTAILELFRAISSSFGSFLKAFGLPETPEVASYLFPELAPEDPELDPETAGSLVASRS